MKYLAILVIVLITSLGVNGQTFVQRTNGSFTPTDPFLNVSWGLYIPRVCDTINAIRGKDTIGLMVFDTCNHKIWIRDWIPPTTQHRWRTAGVQDLQNTTDIGNKTTDTIIAGALMTGNIVADTSDIADYEFDIIGDVHVQLSKPQIVYARTNWIRDNRITQNIKAVFQLGDLTNDATDAPFRVVDTSFRTLDSFNIPNIMVPGNHDYPFNNPCGRDLTKFNSYFGPSRYTGVSWYGGNYNNSNGNHYIKFDAGTRKYMAIGFENWPSDTVLAWGQRVLDSFPDREAIILTHGYITYYKERNVDSSVFSHIDYGGCGTNGQQLWDRFIKRNKQISFVFAGHFIPIDYSTNRTPVVHRITEAGVYGNVINQFVVNYQQDTSLGGNTYMMRMKFRPRTGKLDISFYSPYGNIYDSIRNPAYTIDYPALKTDPTVGVAGKLNVYDEFRADSTVFFTKMPRGKYPVFGPSGRIDTIPNQSANTIFSGPSSGGAANPTFRSLVAADIPTGSGNYIQNQNSSLQDANFLIGGVGKSSVVSSLGSYKNQWNGGGPATLAVLHTSGNWGVAVGRASAGTSGANLVLAHNNNNDWNTLVPASIGDRMGVIYWQGVRSDSAFDFGVQIEGRVEKVTNNYISSGLVIQTKDTTTGSQVGRFRIQADGHTWIGNTNFPSSNPYILQTGAGNNLFNGNLFLGAAGADRLHVAGTVNITDTLKLPNIASKADTTNFKPTVVDASGNMFKMSGWPISGTTYTFNNGLTNTSGTVQFGGTLVQNTTINTGGFTTAWTGSNDNQTSFSVTNTGTTAASAISGTASGTTSIGVSGTSTSYIGVLGSSTSNNGVQGQSTSGTGVVGTSSTGAALRGQINPTSTNAIENIITLLRTSSSGAGANGLGAAIQYELETATNGTSQTAGSLSFEWTDATNATRTSRFRIKGVNSSADATLATFDGDGTFSTTGKRVIAVTTSSAGTLTLGNFQSYVFTGTTTTWTLPAVSGNTGVIYYIKNRGSGNITLNSNAGGNDIYDTAATNTITIAAGASAILINDGTYFNKQ